jgi:hypothetical protein
LAQYFFRWQYIGILGVDVEQADGTRHLDAVGRYAVPLTYGRLNEVTGAEPVAISAASASACSRLIALFRWLQEPRATMDDYPTIIEDAANLAVNDNPGILSGHRQHGGRRPYGRDGRNWRCGGRSVTA